MKFTAFALLFVCSLFASSAAQPVFEPALASFGSIVPFGSHVDETPDTTAMAGFLDADFKLVCKKLAELQKHIMSLPGTMMAAANDLIKLPQVTLIGQQSSGKTSTLEMMARFGFLPRGGSMTTRRPFFIHFIHHAESVPRIVVRDLRFGKVVSREFTLFPSVDPGVEPVETTELRNYLMSQQTPPVPAGAQDGGSRDIIKDKLFLDVYSKDVEFDYTVVDLPGLISLAGKEYVAGTKENIDDLVRSYCSLTNAVLLVVHDSSIDINTDSALAFVHHNDQCGDVKKKGLGVLTKINKPGSLEFDLEISNVKILTGGDTYRIERGWVAITGQPERDVRANKPMHVTLAEEVLFVKDVEARLPQLEGKLGTSALVKKIGAVMATYAADTFHLVELDLNASITTVIHELNSFPPKPPVDTEYQTLFLTTNYVEGFRTLFEQAHYFADSFGILQAHRKAFAALAKQPANISPSLWKYDYEFGVALRSAMQPEFAFVRNQLVDSFTAMQRSTLSFIQAEVSAFKAPSFKTNLTFPLPAENHRQILSFFEASLKRLVQDHVAVAKSKLLEAVQSQESSLLMAVRFPGSGLVATTPTLLPSCKESCSDDDGDMNKRVTCYVNCIRVPQRDFLWRRSLGIFHETVTSHLIVPELLVADLSPSIYRAVHTPAFWMPDAKTEASREEKTKTIAAFLEIGAMLHNISTMTKFALSA